MTTVDDTRRRRVRKHRLLLVLPFVWQLGLAPAVNDVRWTLLNIPFPMLWQLLGIVFASAVIWLVFRLDRSVGVEAEESAFLDETTADESRDVTR